MKALTIEEDRALRKSTNAALAKIHAKHAGRQRGSITEVENDNYQVRKGAAETAIAGLHSGHVARTTIAKAAPASTNGSAAIAALHGDSAFVGRNVSGNATLVEKLATAIGTAIQKDFSNAAEAKRELRKLIDDAPAPDINVIRKRIDTYNSNQEPPRNHSVVKTAKGKAGTATMTYRKGNAYPYLIEVDGCYHSEHADEDRAEKTFARLSA